MIPLGINVVFEKMLPQLEDRRKQVPKNHSYLSQCKSSCEQQKIVVRWKLEQAVEKTKEIKMLVSRGRL